MEIKFLKNKNNLKKARVHIDPFPYWVIAFSTFAAITLLGLVFGFYLFTKINKEFAALDPESKTPTETIKQSRLKEVLDYFSKREEAAKSIIVNPSPVADPSL